MYFRMKALEERVVALEQKMAALEVQAQERPAGSFVKEEENIGDNFALKIKIIDRDTIILFLSLLQIVNAVMLLIFLL